MNKNLFIILAVAAVGIAILAGLMSTGTDPVSEPEPAPRANADSETEIEPPPLITEEADEASAEPTGTAGRLEVLVVNGDDAPVVGAEVKTSSKGLAAASMRAVTDAGGRAVLEGLPSGKKITIRAASGLLSVPDSRVETLVKGEQKTVRLVLKPGGAFTGTVLGEGGAPIGKAFEVSVRPAEVIRGRTINRGHVAARRRIPAGTDRFEIGRLPAGTYTATAKAEGYQPATSEAFEVHRDSISNDVTITMSLGGRIAGIVVDARTGEPVKDAAVWVSSTRTPIIFAGGGRVRRGGVNQVKTDDQGRFVIDGVKPGTYSLQASATDHAGAEIESIVVEKGGETGGIVVRLGEGGGITGTIYGPDGKPLPNAEVLVQHVDSRITIVGDFGERAKADENGVYLIEHLEPGEYRVKPATESGAMMVTILVASESGEKKPAPKNDGTTITVREGEVARHDLHTSGQGSISGRVMDEAGQPRAASVRLRSESPSKDSGAQTVLRVPRISRTDATGKFEFNGLEPGDYTVLVSGEEEPVTVRPGQQVRVEIRVSPGRIEGVVVDESGRPAPRIRARLVQTDRRRMGGMISHRSGNRTDENGRFVFDDVAPGTYRVMVLNGKQTGESRVIEIGRGEVAKNLRVQFESLVPVRVEVRDGEGDPAGQAFVHARAEGRLGGRGRTGENGVTILNLLPGTYTLEVIPRPSEGKVDVGTRVQREITVSRGGGQTVRVRLE